MGKRLRRNPHTICQVYLYMGAGSAATGGGAFPFPLPMDPQALKLQTEITAIATIRSLLIKISSPHLWNRHPSNTSSNIYKVSIILVHNGNRVLHATR